MVLANDNVIAAVEPDDARLSWIARSLHIVDKHGKFGRLIPNNGQLMLHAEIQQQRGRGLPVRIVLLKPRQVGWSTWSEAEGFHDVYHNPNFNAMAVSVDADSTDVIFGMTKRFHDSIPRPLPTDNTNRKALIFSKPHRSAFYAQTAGKLGVGRSFQSRFLHCSEVSFWQDAQNQLAALYQMVPGDAGTTVILESTANGLGGAFYDSYWQAKERVKARPGEYRGYRPVFFPWFEFPEYQTEVPDGWSPTSEEHEMTKEYGLSNSQLYWRRLKIEELSGNESLFRQEYPSCVIGDTLVDFVPIKDTKPTSIILSLHDNGEKEVVTLQTKGGYRLTATLDHRVRTENGFIPINDLSVGSTILLKRPQFSTERYELCFHDLPAVKSSILLGPDIARFLGYFMGDGSYFGDTVSFACNGDLDVQKDILFLFESILGVVPGKRETGKKQGNSFEIRASSKKFRIFWGSLDCLRDGWNKRKVCVPDCIKKSPGYVIKEFLRGLFESDGFNAYKTSRVSLFSKHVEFLRDVQLLLLGFGITSCIKSENKTAGNGSFYTGNVLYLCCNEAIEFNNQIGFVSERKRSRHTRRNPSKHPNAKPLILSDTIASIVPSGMQHVYDLSVVGHEYSANGICVHNCDLEAFTTTGHPVFSVGILKFQEKRILKDVQYGLFDPRTGDFMSHSGSRYGWQYLSGPQDHDFSIGVDTAEYRLSDSSDESSERDFDACVVLDRSTHHVKAIWHGRGVQSELGEQVLGAAKHYNQAWIVPEIPHAMGVLNVLKNANYSQVFSRQEHINQFVETDSDELGFRTTSTTRIWLINDLINALRGDSIYVQFQDILDEFRTFIYDKTGKPIHMPGKHDDLVFALALAIQGDLRCPKESRSGLPERTGDDNEDHKKTLRDLASVGAIDDFDEDEDDEEEDHTW